MTKPNEVNELIEMIQICRNSAVAAKDPYEGSSTYIKGVCLDSFLFVTSKAIAMLKYDNDPKSSGSEDK